MTLHLKVSHEDGEGWFAYLLSCAGLLVFVTPSYPGRSRAVEEALMWVKDNRPGCRVEYRGG